MCSQRLHKPLSLQQDLPLYPPEEKCRVEWQSGGKEGESTEGMNGGSMGEEAEKEENS